MSDIVAIILFWFLLFISIFLHELGHYLVGKKLGYKPSMFYIFALPPIDVITSKNRFVQKLVAGYNWFAKSFVIKKKIGDTEWGIGFLFLPIAFVHLGIEERHMPKKDLLLTAIA